MQELPKADVVITNPTHYAVAIKYDPEVADAPIVVAKGEDYLAARIKEIARENKIEIVENKPLAQDAVCECGYRTGGSPGAVSGSGGGTGICIPYAGENISRKVGKQERRKKHEHKAGENRCDDSNLYAGCFCHVDCSPSGGAVGCVYGI